MTKPAPDRAVIARRLRHARFMVRAEIETLKETLPEAEIVGVLLAETMELAQEAEMPLEEFLGLVFGILNQNGIPVTGCVMAAVDDDDDDDQG